MVKRFGLKKAATITIAWNSYSNEDLADDDDPNPDPDEGWYIDVDTDNFGGTIGNDCFGPGYKTFDEALAVVKKWAGDRGLKINTEVFFLVASQPVDE